MTDTIVVRENTDNQRPDPSRGNCTFKQDRFAKAMAEGKTLVEAYSLAYPNQASRDRSSISADASKLKANPKVRDRISYYIAKHERYSSYNPAKLRSLAIETIMAIAESETAKHSDRLKAAELLGKVSGVGLFETTNNDPTIAKLNSALDLEAKLRQLAGMTKPLLINQPIDSIKDSIDDLNTVHFP